MSSGRPPAPQAPDPGGPERPGPDRVRGDGTPPRTSARSPVTEASSDTAAAADQAWGRHAAG